MTAPTTAVLIEATLTTRTARLRALAAEAKLTELTSDDMADRLALAAWQHDYPGRTLATATARDLYHRHYAPLGTALVAVLRATAERTDHA